MLANQGHEWIKRIAISLFIVISTWWGLSITSPPAPKPADAPATEFSAQRAFRHVQKIAQRPHMVGTAEHDSVKKYIVDELERLGVNPTIEEAITSRSNFLGQRVVHTQNIIARIEGTDSEQTIMLMAHYDSAIYAPGAADDGSGVAAILELIRAIKAGEPLKNDLLILLTDGEELGLMGARHFASSNEAMEEIDLILNLEARGTSGRSVMFETNSGNAKLIPLFAESTKNPVANSLTYSIYKILPYNTDFSVFKPHGIQGLNFAFIEGFLNYHTMQDSPENLSLASLQHHGENLLDNVWTFGNRTFDLETESDLVYFNNPFGGLTYYPESWSHYLTGITVALFILALFIGYRNQWVSLKDILLGLSTYLAILLVSAVTTWFGWNLIEQYIFPKYQWIQHGETYEYLWYLWFFMTITTLIAVPALRWTKHKININNLLAGIYLTSITLLVTLTLFLPAANYLLLWPIFFGIIGWIFTGKQLQHGMLNGQALAILAISLFMLLFMVPFYIKFIQITLTTQLLVVSMLLFVFMLGLLYPLVDYIVEEAPRVVYGLLGFIALACFCGAALNSDYNSNQKKQNSLIYANNLDSSKSYWLSMDHTTDEWTSQFLGSEPKDSLFTSLPLVRGDQLLYSEAPSLNINSPHIELISNHTKDSLRIVTLQFNHSYPANATIVRFSDNSQIRQVQLEEKTLYSQLQPVERQPNSFSGFTFFGDMKNPFTIQITIPVSREDLQVETTSYNLAFPDELMQNYSQRPPSMMPKPRGFSYGTIWTKTVSLEEVEKTVH